MERNGPPWRELDLLDACRRVYRPLTKAEAKFLEALRLAIETAPIPSSLATADGRSGRMLAWLHAQDD